MKNPYDVLGVPHDATEDQIQKAYRKLAKQYHPDRNPGDDDAVVKYREVQEAYDYITNGPPKRQQQEVYDFHHDPFDMFSQFFNFGRQQQAKRGKHVETDCSVSFLDAAAGCDVEISIRRGDVCPSCNGTRAAKDGVQTCSTCNGQGAAVYKQGNMTVKTTCGQCGGSGSRITKPCQECAGEGTIKDTHKLKVKLPAGVKDGDVVRLPGQGERGAAVPGDVYLTVRVMAHPLFRRDKDDITYKMPVSYTQAVLGHTTEVPVIGSMHKIVIPSGSKPGDVIRIPGHGLKNPQTGRVGDCLVVLDVDTTPPRGDVEDLLAKLREAETKNPSKTILEWNYLVKEVTKTSRT